MKKETMNIIVVKIVCGSRWIMDKKEIVRNVVKANDGIAKTKDFINAGLSNCDVAKLCNDGFITRIRHGFYQLTMDQFISEEKQLKEMIPEAIFCLESALFYYGYIDFTPRKWHIAVPRTISRTKLSIEDLPIQTYYVQDDIYYLGQTKARWNEVEVNIYDRERVICDCFKFRSRIDNELFHKALYAYIKDEEKNLTNLSEYARKLRVFNKMNDIMEVLLNGGFS